MVGFVVDMVSVSALFGLLCVCVHDDNAHTVPGLVKGFDRSFLEIAVSSDLIQYVAFEGLHVYCWQSLPFVVKGHVSFQGYTSVVVLFV